MSKKIAYLLGSLNRGGTETLVLDVFRNAKNNKLAAIGVYRKTGVFEKEFKESRVEMIQLSVGKNPIAYLLGLRKLLIKNKMGIAHAQQPIDALYAWLACMGTGIRVLLTFHGYDFANNLRSNKILRFIIKRTDINIFVSDTQRKYYQEKYGLNIEKQKVVYNGISFDKLDVVNRSEGLTSSQAFTNLRTELQLSSDALLLGAVGNFNDVRDQLTTCRFLKQLYELKVNFHFVFVGKKIEGTPELYTNCVRYCQDNGLSKVVSFLGSRNDVPQILNELDAFVYSTDHDTFGIAVVEAMAVGIPVFVNDWGVMNEITDGGKYATLYKTKDEQDLLRQFMLFLQYRQEYEEKAKKAAAYVLQKYNIENHISKLKEVYSSL
jgi:glycosyltransferase involved in cell wall biosynthesis